MRRAHLSGAFPRCAAGAVAAATNWRGTGRSRPRSRSGLLRSGRRPRTSKWRLCSSSKLLGGVGAAGVEGSRADVCGDPRKRRGEENRSEEHTSELQSRGHLVCRLLLEKKKKA